MGGAPKKIEPLARGAAKISRFEFQYLHPPPAMLNELSLREIDDQIVKSFTYFKAGYSLVKTGSK